MKRRPRRQYSSSRLGGQSGRVWRRPRRPRLANVAPSRASASAVVAGFFVSGRGGGFCFTLSNHVALYRHTFAMRARPRSYTSCAPARGHYRTRVLSRHTQLDTVRTLTHSIIAAPPSPPPQVITTYSRRTAAPVPPHHAGGGPSSLSGLFTLNQWPSHSTGFAGLARHNAMRPFVTVGESLVSTYFLLCSAVCAHATQRGTKREREQRVRDKNACIASSSSACNACAGGVYGLRVPGAAAPRAGRRTSDRPPLGRASTSHTQPPLSDRHQTSRASTTGIAPWRSVGRTGRVAPQTARWRPCQRG